MDIGWSLVCLNAYLGIALDMHSGIDNTVYDTGLLPICGLFIQCLTMITYKTGLSAMQLENNESKVNHTLKKYQG